MLLSSPLVIGQTYQVSYSEKADTTYHSHTIDSLLFSVSLSGMSFGIQIHSSLPVAIPSWTPKVFTFTGLVGGEFLTIKNRGFVDGWNFIDNLQIELISPSGSFNLTDKKQKTILKITNVLGEPTKPKPNTPLFYIYDDGTVEKKVVIE